MTLIFPTADDNLYQVICNEISCDYKTIDNYTAETSVKVAKESITIIHINFVSLPKNFDALKLFLSQCVKAVDVICISETRLTDSKAKFCNLAGYQLFFCNSNTRAGGSTIFVTDRLKSQQLAQNKIRTEGWEDVWAEIKLEKNESLIVGSVYRHPNNNIKYFEDAFVNIIKSFNRREKFIVLGDFNINYGNIASSPNIADYFNYINNLKCLQLVDKPTPITQTSTTIIDRIYINSTSLSDETPIIFCEDSSDHLPVCAEIKCRPSKKSTMRPYTRKLTQENVDLFLVALANSLNTPDMRGNKNLDSLITLMSNLINQYFPQKMLSRK